MKSNNKTGFILFILCLIGSQSLIWLFPFELSLIDRVLEVLENEKRVFSILALCTVICGGHYVFERGRRFNKISYFKAHDELFYAITSIATYAVIINSSISVLIFSLSLQQNDISYNVTEFDKYSIFAAAIAPLVWAVLQLYSLLKELLNSFLNQDKRFDPLPPISKELDKNQIVRDLEGK